MLSAANRARDEADQGPTIRPQPRSWREVLGHNTSTRARRFREQLGLPVDRPIVMTGHQAQFWHPGILAKYLAADAFANACAKEVPPAKPGSVPASHSAPAVAFLVVDQVSAARVSIRYPVVEEHGNLAVREAAFGNGQMANGQMANLEERTPEFVRKGMEAIERAMQEHEGEQVLSRRVALAVRDLMAPYLSEQGRGAAMVFATELWRTDLFTELVERMRRERERCVAAYNAAVSRHPEAGIRPLVADEVQDRWELPLWRLGERRDERRENRESRGGRRHVYAEDLPQVPRQELAPKAILMTGLMRMAGCDLFIHGTGGGGGEADGGYEAVTDAWLRGWLGEEFGEGGGLAPITVVTATRRLRLDVPRPPTPEEVERAVWRLHHALHHPAEVGLEPLEAQRQALVAEIAVAAPEVRERLFLDLHALLERYQAGHGSELGALRSETERIVARRGDGAILADRTWAFALYPEEVVRGLAEEIRGEFSKMV